MFKSVVKFVDNNRYLISIVIFGSILRLTFTTVNPPSLNWDEVSHGYNAYSILETGKDEWGVRLPLIFKAYGDFKLPVYIYITAISEFLLGLNVLAVRLPSILAGITSIIFTFKLVKLLFKNNFLALLSAFLVTIEPWSLFLSRGAFEANLGFALFVIGVYFFLKGLKNPKYLILNSIFFGLSVWTYNSYRIFTPLMSIVLFAVYKNDILTVFKASKKLSTYYLILTAIFFIPMLWQLLNPVGQARYGKVALIDEGAIGRIIELRNEFNFSPLIERLLFNRPIFFLDRFTKNYISHFSPKYLFIEGGTHYQFSVPFHGLLYWVNIPFILLGLYSLLKKRDSASTLLIYWLLLAPIPSSITREAPHVLRSITLLPIPMILTAYGFLAFTKQLNNKLRLLSLVVYVIITLMFLENYLVMYFEEYRANYSWSWQYGYAQVVEYAKENYKKYDRIIVNKKYGEAHEFVLFNWPWDPKIYHNDPNLIRFYQSNWYWVDRFDKFYFVNDWNIPKEERQDFLLESGEKFGCKSQRCLLITSPNNFPKTWNKLKVINFLNGKPAFEIYEN